MAKRILLVDDDSSYLFILKHRIARIDASVRMVTAANGAEALGILEGDALRKEMPDIIITDIEMPVMGGIAFTREAARLGLVDFSRTRVILNSQGSRYGSIDWGTDHPGAAFFPKPLTEECLRGIFG
ncbi:response regulator [Rufibacter latericius]|uniref:response regulator n=1 Tax=Rufibacter latericius TaxID=2487040 RepID=UPI00140280FE|nr:response regulator [Rufibacter latericius]